MVTADGTIRNIDASKEPELAVALRGSGSQFGEHVDSLLYLANADQTKVLPPSSKSRPTRSGKSGAA